MPIIGQINIMWTLFNIPDKMYDLNPKENFRQAQTEEYSKKFKSILKI